MGRVPSARRANRFPPSGRGAPPGVPPQRYARRAPSSQGASAGRLRPAPRNKLWPNDVWATAWRCRCSCTERTHAAHGGAPKPSRAASNRRACLYTDLSTAGPRAAGSQRARPGPALPCLLVSAPRRGAPPLGDHRLPPTTTRRPAYSACRPPGGGASTRRSLAANAGWGQHCIPRRASAPALAGVCAGMRGHALAQPSPCARARASLRTWAPHPLELSGRAGWHGCWPCQPRQLRPRWHGRAGCALPSGHLYDHDRFTRLLSLFGFRMPARLPGRPPPTVSARPWLRGRPRALLCLLLPRHQ